jgi:hypothetical protein
MTRRLKITNGDSGGSSAPPYYKPSPLAVIDTMDDQSLEKWGEILHLSQAELQEAIKDYGTIVRDIRRGLRKNHQDAA